MGKDSLLLPHEIKKHEALPQNKTAQEIKIVVEGGVDAAEKQIKANQYTEPFKADKRRVIALAVELDDKGKGLVDWKEVQ